MTKHDYPYMVAQKFVTPEQPRRILVYDETGEIVVAIDAGGIVALLESENRAKAEIRRLRKAMREARRAGVCVCGLTAANILYNALKPQKKKGRVKR